MFFSFIPHSVALPLPSADSNISVPTHTVALCHHVRQGQCVDEANSKVSGPLWMLVRGHFRYSAKPSPGTQRGWHVASFIYILLSLHIHIHPVIGIKYAIPSIPRFLWGNDSLTCIVSEHAFASSPNLRCTTQEAQVKNGLIENCGASFAR